MRTTVRETLFSNVMLDPNRQREMYSMDEYQLSMRHNSLP